MNRVDRQGGRRRWGLRTTAIVVMLGVLGVAPQPRVQAQASYTLLTGGTANMIANAFTQWVSDDGSKVFFVSAEQLSALDTDQAQDVYVTSGGVITLLSGGSLDEPAMLRRITRDG